MINSLEKLEIVKVRGEAAQIWGLAVAAAGGEMRSNYFQNTAQNKTDASASVFILAAYSASSDIMIK
jgi:hypothetical protein